jgi:NADH dehydrogenase [ubiquinone] 1 alpha subcomplex assembly factor 7
MREALTNPQFGYYMTRDVIGREGDFITAPELSQIFGEIIGLWCILIWENLGKPSVLRLVELGPGRATLLKDILRVSRRFSSFHRAMSLHLIEISPYLRHLQAQVFNLQYPDMPIPMKDKPKPKLEVASTFTKIERKEESFEDNAEDFKRLKEQLLEKVDLLKEKILRAANPLQDVKLTLAEGNEIYWHQEIRSIPPGPTIIIAQEYFDALPVYQFQYTEKGWRERLIDIDAPDGPHYLRFVLAPTPTPASLAFREYLNEDAKVGEVIELSAEGMTVAHEIGKRLNQFGGGALIIDYGFDHPSSFSLRAVKKHTLVDVLAEPGNVDLSCNVDFSALRRAALEMKTNRGLVKNEKIKVWGPVTQSDFLLEMGIEARLAQLLLNVNDEQIAAQQIAAFERLISPQQMGTIYKAMALTNIPGTKLEPLSGFHSTLAN